MSFWGAIIPAMRKEMFMKNAYPIVMTKENGIVVYIPDFDINTQGENEAEAIAMARDAIGLMGIDMEDDGEKIPEPSKIFEVEVSEGQFVTLVDVDFVKYRRQHDMRTVRRNVSLPSWLNDAADEANVNVSAILQKALKLELGLT